MNNLAFDATKASKMGLDAIRHKCLTNITSLHFTVNKQNTFLQELDEVLFGGPNRDYPKLSMLSIDGSRTYITKHIHSINDLFKF